MVAVSARSHTYRWDLNGLRGVAIGLVVLFHVFGDRVSGGVDVFLLLSGYFFLGSQLRYAIRRNASLNPWWPIWRTLRRLIPSLSVVLAATVALVLWLVPQLMSPELAKQLPASLFHYLNWELIRQDADYAAASADTSPLQHLWSMSVQGQFYLFAIFFALGFAVLVRRRGWDDARVRRVAGPILIGVTVLSFAWACRDGLIGSPANYYSTFSRTWELTLGAVLALYLPYLRIPPRLAGPATAVGLAMIALTGFLIPVSLAFPGPAALLPIGGAVLVIAGGGDNATSRLLASRPATWLGGVAYPLYLWHWPLLIILTTATGSQTPPLWLGVAVIALSLALAELTHRFVETPLSQRSRRPTREQQPMRSALQSLRDRPGQRRAASGAVVSVVVVALLSVSPVYASYLTSLDDQESSPTLHPGAAALGGPAAPDWAPLQPDPAFVAGIRPAPTVDKCLVHRGAPVDRFTGEGCVYGDPEAEDTVVLAGGSHAETWMTPLAELGLTHGFRVVPFLRQSCPVVLGEHYGVSDDCAAWSEGAVERILELDPEVVISTTTRPIHDGGPGPDLVPAGYENFWRILDEHEVAFFGLRDNPWVHGRDQGVPDANRCLLNHAAGGVTFVDDPDPLIACAVPRAKTYEPVDPAAVVLANYPTAVAVDTADWFCGPELCPPAIGNVPVYRDDDHVSNAYAATLGDLLWERLRPVLGR